jgi:hypothetical protein
MKTKKGISYAGEIYLHIKYTFGVWEVKCIILLFVRII